MKTEIVTFHAVGKSVVEFLKDKIDEGWIFIAMTPVYKEIQGTPPRDPYDSYYDSDSDGIIPSVFEVVSAECIFQVP